MGPSVPPTNVLEVGVAGGTGCYTGATGMVLTTFNPSDESYTYDLADERAKKYMPISSNFEFPVIAR